ncbi:aspartate aminotransferase family protein [Candidatus Lokiarchaeum ossiferum]|uniref:aspartate aminotransferase family protein n=1 Tax=Candidatus Lokiarchaeum ossiferum TaxID=2951803 RepID=UPI00352C8A21
MTEHKYGLTHWPDANEIRSKLDILVSQDLRTFKNGVMDNYLQYFETKCQKSKEITTRAKKFIPGGVQHNLAFNYPFPICIEKADGAFMWDKDGNKYIDFLQAGGPTLLGSNWKPVRDKVIDVLNSCGPVTGLFHEYELKIAELINHHMPNVEMVRLLGSGTEADMGIARLARVFTGKKKIIKEGGAYHGWSDQFVYGLHIPGTADYEAHGIPHGCLKNTQEFFPNDIEELRTLLVKNVKRGGTAAVFLEPFGPESGTRPRDREFCKQARELCDEFETLLVFDEVVTGFRSGMGGAQGYFGVKPDLTTFGKIIAGGYPMAGGIGGRADIVSCAAAGVETGKQRAYVGGTLSANPLTCVAGYWAIKEIERTEAYYKAALAGDRLINGVQKLIDQFDLPFVAYNQGSLCHVETAGAMLVDMTKNGALEDAFSRKAAMHEIGAAYMAEGMITLAGSRLYTNMTDTDDVIDDALVRFERVFSSFA